MKLLLLIFLLYAKNLYADETESVLCSAEYCATYADTDDCKPIPDNCKIQNETHNGVFFDSPDPCNCCQYCIANLNEGDFCYIGETGGPVPDAMCGPGLTCYAENEDNPSEAKCVKMETVGTTPCTKAQKDYDERRLNGSTGTLEVRPNCDGSGFYVPYKCIPGLTCFCVDQDGNRIFGEIKYTSTANLILKCQCSRKYSAAVAFLDLDRELHPNEHFRCAENGDYDTIQCIGNDCMCTDAYDGALTFPKTPPVNISDISMETLPDCFNEEKHETGKYYHECATKYLEMLDELNELLKIGYDAVFDFDAFPSCTIDGKYAPVMKDAGRAYCVDPDGKYLAPYNVSMDNAKDMDCKCARSSLLLDESPENPVCCLNGNFNPIQCRRDICYCVDSDGYQDIQYEEVPRNEKDQLGCFNNVDQNLCPLSN